MLISLVTSLLLTVVIELGVLALLRVRGKQNFLVALYANMLTNPPVVFVADVLFLFYPSVAWPLIFLLEMGVVLVEGWIYRRYLSYNVLNPWVLALLANLISFQTGITLSYFGS